MAALTVKPPGCHLAHLSKRHFSTVVGCRRVTEHSGDGFTPKRRDFLITPFLAIGAYALRSAVAKADENPYPEVETTSGQRVVVDSPETEELEEMLNSRIYDATVIGEPMAIGKDKRKVWDKIMSARVVYLGEAEQVPIEDDKELELDIVKCLMKRCSETDRSMSLALEAFPCDLQEQLDQFVDRRINGETLKSFASHLSPQRWQEYEPLLTYCRDNGIRLIACGVPVEVLRTVQAEGIRGLSKTDRKKYAPPAGSGFISGFPYISKRSFADANFPIQSGTYGSKSYLSIQARVVEDYTMSQVILQGVTDGGSSGMIVVIAGANHLTYGSRGTGLPARISRKMQKKNQVTVLLNPERQYIRREGDAPVADFLWYSAARPCSRNCFDRAEIARVMDAAGRKREALPQDLQNGLDLGLVSPEVLQNFFDLEQYPALSELSHRFQGFRERLLADPKFLHRLAIEESISLTTTLLAQYERRKENFFEEIDYVITDTLRATVVDFFSVWLPAPTISFLPSAGDITGPDSIDAVRGLLGSIPDNAFQKNIVGRSWNLNQRIASVFVSGSKLASVAFISSLLAVASSNSLFSLRKILSPSLDGKQRNIRSPILKTALVYGGFLGTSSNLRYQVISGLVEHRFSEQFSDQTLLVNLISFVARTINCYWGAQQWIDLARYTGLQARKGEEEVSFQMQDPSNTTAIECRVVEDSIIDEGNNR